MLSSSLCPPHPPFIPLTFFLIYFPIALLLHLLCSSDILCLLITLSSIPLLPRVLLSIPSPLTRFSPPPALPSRLNFLSCFSFPSSPFCLSAHSLLSRQRAPATPSPCFSFSFKLGTSSFYFPISIRLSFLFCFLHLFLFLFSPSFLSHSLTHPLLSPHLAL